MCQKRKGAAKVVNNGVLTQVQIEVKEKITMIPKEKAKNLFEMFYSFKSFKLKPDSDYSAEKRVAKKQAQLCVDEILIACNQIYDSDIVHFKETAMGEWWLAVKAEIEKL